MQVIGKNGEYYIGWIPEGFDFGTFPAPELTLL
jgi:hypothetical protein